MLKRAQMNENLKKVQKFIFNENIQTIISKINSNLMDFNILEITGMGTQEIKHSNILGWFFDDSEHNLGYQILNDFLRKVIEENEGQTSISGLQSYLYLSTKKQDIVIHREKDNIDLLIVDEENKVVIAFENKLYATERIEGSDDGQLSKYENIINSKYKSQEYKKYFIFLTKDLEEPEKGKECWLKAKHQNVTDVLSNLITTKKELTTKTKIIFESYIDLLKRSGIVPDETLEKLCKEIWNKKEYREAFEIILNNKPHRYEELLNYIKSFNGVKILEEKSHSNVRNIFVSMNHDSPFVYRFIYNVQKSDLSFVVVSKEKNLNYKFLVINEKKLTLDPKYNKETQSQFDYYIVSRFLNEYKTFMLLDKDINSEKINTILFSIQTYDKNYLDSKSRNN